MYTLNIDNCFECAFREVISDKGLEETSLEVLNFDESFVELRSDVKCSLIHLHGVVDQSASGYIFSRNEYAKSLTQPNSWMLTLSQLIRTELFVVAGTSLDEIDVEYYLALRSQKTSRSDIPKSILIEPCPTKLTEKLCKDHDFCLFRGSVLEVLAELNSIEPKLTNSWNTAADDGLSGLGFTNAERVRFASSFELVPSEVVAASNPARFLLGAQLTWEMVSANADIPRDAYNTIRYEIVDLITRNEARLLLLADHPGSGKSAILKRLAFDLSRSSSLVFWYSGLGLEMEPQAMAKLIDRIPQPVLVFVDNFADAVNTVQLVLERTLKKELLFVCAERDYRLGYIENTFTSEDYVERSNLLKLTVNEATRLWQEHAREGISTLQNISESKYLAEVVGRPIAEANCRIQNNFKTMDLITSDLVSECTPEENSAFLAVALARFCFALGVRRSALSEIRGSGDIEFLLSEQAPLRVKYTDYGKVFVAPANPLIGDRVLEASRKTSPKGILQAFVDLASSLAPRVTPATIKLKTPEAQLLGRLMDYDNNVKRFIDDRAEEYYKALKSSCGWNARYWEQLALLKLDRFFASPTDTFLLDESIQHARSAISAELHPFSLTTLAKVLFQAMEANKANRDQFFTEAWKSITEADDRESKWPSRGATLFNVCFRGVLKYISLGGQLTGDQYTRFRDMVSTTHALKIKDKGLLAKRNELVALLSGELPLTTSPAAPSGAGRSPPGPRRP